MEPKPVQASDFILMCWKKLILFLVLESLIYYCIIYRLTKNFYWNSSTTDYIGQIVHSYTLTHTLPFSHPLLWTAC